jgi:hypothetical protein
MDVYQGTALTAQNDNRPRDSEYPALLFTGLGSLALF